MHKLSWFRRGSLTSTRCCSSLVDWFHRGVHRLIELKLLTRKVAISQEAAMCLMRGDHSEEVQSNASVRSYGPMQIHLRVVLKFVKWVDKALHSVFIIPTRWLQRFVISLNSLYFQWCHKRVWTDLLRISQNPASPFLTLSTSDLSPSSHSVFLPWHVYPNVPQLCDCALLQTRNVSQCLLQLWPACKRAVCAISFHVCGTDAWRRTVLRYNPLAVCFFVSVFPSMSF